MSLQPAYSLTIFLQIQAGNTAGWMLFLLGLFALVAFLLWFRQASEEDLTQRTYFERHHPTATAMPSGFTLSQTAVLPSDPSESAHDHGHHTHHEVAEDLTKVEGIGPKIADLLQEAGISSYQKLAASEADLLRTLLDAAGPQFQLADPTTWPEQAQLLAAGKLEELEQLQAQLKGGRQVN